MLRAKRVLKARTETEAIILSLEEAVFMNEVERAVWASSGALPRFSSLRWRDFEAIATQLPLLLEPLDRFAARIGATPTRP